MSESGESGEDLSGLSGFFFYVFIVHPCTAWILRPGRFERKKSIMYAIAFLAAIAAIKTGEKTQTMKIVSWLRDLKGVIFGSMICCMWVRRFCLSKCRSLYEG